MISNSSNSSNNQLVNVIKFPLFVFTKSSALLKASRTVNASIH